MPDLSSLIVVIGLFLGAVVGNAAYFGDPTSVHITVSPKMTAAGFTRDAAEDLFATKASEISAAVSIVPTPNFEISTRPNLAEAIAEPLNLGGVVAATQNLIGVSVTMINCTIIDDAKTSGLRMLMIVSVPREPTMAVNLARDDGDVEALIQQAARLALERVAPYRVALSDFDNGAHGNAATLGSARDTATRMVAMPWMVGRPTERVMLYNLLGLLALADSDMPGAEKQFRAGNSIVGALPGAYGTIAMNQTFLAVAAKRPADARRWFERSRSDTASVQLPGWTSEVDLLAALVAWSEGNTSDAEALLREAADGSPTDRRPHFYLAKLLAARGGDAAAAAAHAAMLSNQQDTHIPSLAQSEFWVDPMKGGLTLAK